MDRLSWPGLEGKVALVTGAGRETGIGRAIALMLASAGCDVVVTGVTRPCDAGGGGGAWLGVETVVQELESLGRRGLACYGDVSDAKAVERIFADSVERFGNVDILVNNAAASRGRDRVPVVDMDVDEWDKVLNVNLKGTFLMSSMAIRRWVDVGGDGCIVNISSIAGKMALPDLAAYAVSKAAIQSLSRCLARDVGGLGIRVNAVCPGPIDTARMSDVSDEQWKDIVSKIPMGRLGLTREIAAAVAYLVSDHGGWITGQAINVDGGMAALP